MTREEDEKRRASSGNGYLWYIIVAIALVAIGKAYVGTLDIDQKGESSKSEIPAKQENSN